MATADISSFEAKRDKTPYERLKALARRNKENVMAARAVKLEPATPFGVDVLENDETRKHERFIPVTRHALMDRLTMEHVWPDGNARQARRFFRYLDYWRQQQYTSRLIELDENYEPFSPDSDLLMTREYGEEARTVLCDRVVEQVEELFVRANYEKIDPHDVDMILTQESHYGLDLYVDMDTFEHILIYYRGASNRKYERRRWQRFFRKEEFNVPIFQRLFLLFKLKPFEQRVDQVMEKDGLSREDAEKLVTKTRAKLPDGIKDNLVYLKLFKNIPRTDLEMVFPNTEVRFRLRDKLRLGLTAGGGLGMGAISSAGKIALLTSNPITAIGAIGGLGAIAFRQAMGFVNQKNRYMVVMAQNLYFHTMADNRGVILKIAARAAEEDLKEEMLLYSVLAKEPANRSDLPAIDAAIEDYLERVFGVPVDFEIEDALERLVRDGVVAEDAEGNFSAMPPDQALLHIDHLWDHFLDELPDPMQKEGIEVDAISPPPLPTTA